MSIETEAELKAMLSDWDSMVFSSGDTYPNRNNKTKTINCIFDESYVAISGVESLTPVAQCLTADVVDAVHGSMLEDGPTKYRVVSIQPDGQAYTLLILERQTS